MVPLARQLNHNNTRNPVINTKQNGCKILRFCQWEHDASLCLVRIWRNVVRFNRGRGSVSQKDTVCVRMGACLIAEIQPPKATIYSSRVLMNNTSVGIQCTLAFLSLMHAAREYRRKQRTFLMSCFSPCKSCQRAGCVLENAVGLLC